MNQPPRPPCTSPPQPGNSGPNPAPGQNPSPKGTLRRPAWRLPEGVAAGTWEYTQTDSIATGYQRFLAQTPLIKRDIEWLLGELPSPLANRATRVIDLGCGDGRALRALWEAGYEVLGVDLSQPMLREVTRKEHGNEIGRRLLRANLVQLDGLRDGSADHACCLFSTIGMIRGRRHRRQFLGHVARILKPGGTLVLHVHNRNSAWRDRPSAAAWLRSAWEAIRFDGNEMGDRTYSYRGLSDMFLHTYSRSELLHDFVASGWKVVRLVPLSIDGGAALRHPNLLPGRRAGGFLGVARSPH